LGKEHPPSEANSRKQAEWQQRMGAFMNKTSTYGMNIVEPTRYANLSSQFEQLQADYVRGHKKLSDVQAATSTWKSSGGAIRKVGMAVPAPAMALDATVGLASAPASAAVRWIAYTKGWMPGNETIGDVQFGYEITSSSGGLNFNTDNLTISGG
jgi:hypothetical protein